MHQIRTSESQQQQQV